MPQVIEKHIKTPDSGITAIDLLADSCPLSKQQLKSAMTNGAVWLESRLGIHRIRRAKKALKQGDILHLYYDSTIQSCTAEPAVLVADEGDYSIWNKPYGMYSQGSKWGDHCTLYRWAEQHLEPRRSAYPVHRLDRAATGLIILAHNRKTANEFLEMFKQRTITKHYRATVEGNLSTVDLPHTIAIPLDGKPAESVILQADFDQKAQTTNVLIDIKTGRKHQIRRHLSLMGHPIAGDRLYGAKNLRCNLQLSAVFLSFLCPVNQAQRNYSLP